MLRPRRCSRRRRACGQRGFTLIEMVVAMAGGLAIVAAAVSMLFVVLHQSQRSFSKVSATQRARTMLANLENELHSACVDGTPPIQGTTTGVTPTSDANDLVFVSFYGTAADPAPLWHQITFSGTTLTEYTYLATSPVGTNDQWTRGTLQATTSLLTNVSQLTGTPVFQYYAYKQEYTDASGNRYMLIPDGTSTIPGTSTAPNTPLSTSAGLSSSDADTVVEVNINLLVGPGPLPTDNPSLTAVDAPITDSVSMRLTTPPDYVPAGVSPTGYGPCQ
jgi:type II secretory pathway pseudopilin PulG